MIEPATALATEDDVPVLLDMMADFNRIEGISWSRGPGEEALRRLLGDASLGVVGLFVDSRVLGYFVMTFGYDLEWGGRDAFLTEIYLRPEHRGAGRGRVFMAAIEEHARAREVRALHLMVRPENVVARHLYAACGYVVPPRVFMTKDLSD